MKTDASKVPDKSGKIPVLVLFAPTACGKTDFLLNNFTRKSPFDVISADSVQVYRGMDIGSAKPSAAEQGLVPHGLIDIRNPDQKFSAAEFVAEADALCRKSHGAKRIPFICGGSGFYIRNFLLGLPETPAGDEALRASLNRELEKKGSLFMWERLLAVDAESAEKISPKDSYRVLRALEIFELTGKPRSSFLQNEALRKEYDFCILIFERERKDLYSRIEKRVDRMFECGLESEVRALSEKYGKDAPGLLAIGYREFFENCNDAAKANYGKPMTATQIRAKIKHDSKKYAKKQIVFMNGIPGAKKFLFPQEEAAALKEIEAFKAAHAS